MTTMHPQVDYYVGDSILLDFTCTDAAGAVLPLNNVKVEWMLNDPDGNNVETLSIRDGQTTGDIAIINGGQGKIAVTVPPSRTRTYNPGYYSDQLRVMTPSGGFEDIVATEIVGTILIRPSLRPGLNELETGGLEAGSPSIETPTAAEV